jgi:hypothetical protein
MAKSSRKPMMMTADAAGAHILRCFETRPLQLTGFVDHLSTLGLIGSCIDELVRV